MRKLKSSAIFAGLLVSTAISAQSPTQSPQIVLWKGIAAGMTAEQAAAPAAAIDGVKRVKVVPAKRAGQITRLNIIHTADRVRIADMPFELQIGFAATGAQTVGLISQDQCGAEAMSVFDTLSKGLLAKYPERLGSPKGLTDSDRAQANLHSLESGQKEILTYWYANDDVAVILMLGIGTDKPPPFPSYSSKVAYSLWQFARNGYETRKAECSGTGDQRMNIFLRYSTRANLEAELQRIKSEIKGDRAKLVDQL